MAWQCPDCGRQFRNKNQWHSCYTTPIEDHLAKCEPGILETFARIHQYCKKLNNVTINPVKTSIQYRVESTFLSIRTFRNKLKLEFTGTKTVQHPLIDGMVPVSGNRTFYMLTLKDKEEVTPEILELIHQSYLIITG